jgi:sodium/proline symporter
MSRDLAVLITLVAYTLLLLSVGVWAARRTRDRDDFFLGGRQLGPWVAALSTSASASSAWTLLGVSGAAYAWGFKAVWLFPAVMGGLCLNWIWIAPRLRRIAQAAGALTLTEVLVDGLPTGWARWVARASALIILVSFLFYIAAQLQAAGHAFSTSFDLTERGAILLGTSIVLAYTLIGGFWAVSVTDSVQGLLMVLTALALPAFALVLTGGPLDLLAALGALEVGGTLRPGGELAGVAALAFVAGTLGIGFGYPGQPHVVNRYMALYDDAALRLGRMVALAWGAIVFGGMLILGWSARVLFGEAVADGEQVMFEFVYRLFSPVMAGIVVAAVLSAVMSTADSQLLVAASAVSHDWRLPTGGDQGLAVPRLVVVALSVLALVLALALPATIFERVLFAWHALGSAFGPLLLVRLAGRVVAPPAVLASLLSGFGLTVILSWLPNTHGDVAERLLPFVVALFIAAWNSTRGGARS